MVFENILAFIHFMCIIIHFSIKYERYFVIFARFEIKGFYEKDFRNFVAYSKFMMEAYEKRVEIMEKIYVSLVTESNLATFFTS